MTEATDTDIGKYRPHFLGQTNFYNLNAACRTVLSAFAFGYGVFLVGSSLRTKEYRDVDIRVILPDEKFGDLFPDYQPKKPDPYWNFLCTSISEWLQARTGLPVDFQVQSAMEANAEFPVETHPRNALGRIL